MEHIAPDAVVNDNSQYLHDLLSEFEDPRLVSNWLNQGQILLDFIEMNEKLEHLKSAHEGDIETRFESLKPQIADLCSRIKLFPCPTSKHRLCQTEISGKLLRLVHGICLTCPEINPGFLIREAVDKLPLPKEYLSHQVRYFFDSTKFDL